MSTMPPPTADQPEYPPGPCPPAAEPRNGLAVAALVVGILGIVLCPLGPLLGLIAIALGIVALARAGNLPGPFSRRRMAIAGICLGGAAVLVGGASFFALIPALARARELNMRAMCTANERGIWQGLHIYANDNEGWFPIKMWHEPPEDAADRTVVSFIGQMGAYRSIPVDLSPTGDRATNEGTYPDPNTPDVTARRNSVHPSRSLFLLIINGTVMAKQFVCPSSADTEDDLWVGSGPRPTRAVAPGVTLLDFRGYPYLSYGYQLPFGRRGKPSENLDPRMPILADKGPYFDAGTPRADGTVPDRPVGIPGSSLTIAGATTAAQLRQLGNEQWRPYNSRNHGKEGQNVLFEDGHVEFAKRPIVGVNYDNIYTVQGPAWILTDAMLGRIPADKMGPFTETDSVIVP